AVGPAQPTSASSHESPLLIVPASIFVQWEGSPRTDAHVSLHVLAGVAVNGLSFTKNPTTRRLSSAARAVPSAVPSVRTNGKTPPGGNGLYFVASVGAEGSGMPTGPSAW